MGDAGARGSAEIPSTDEPWSQKKGLFVRELAVSDTRGEAQGGPFRNA